jgi:hypothetical protein
VIRCCTQSLWTDRPPTDEVCVSAMVLQVTLKARSEEEVTVYLLKRVRPG